MDYFINSYLVNILFSAISLSMLGHNLVHNFCAVSNTHIRMVHFLAPSQALVLLLNQIKYKSSSQVFSEGLSGSFLFVSKEQVR